LAGILKVDTLQSDSNLALKIATANVAFIDSNGLNVVGGNLTIGATQFAEGGQIQTAGIADDAVTSDKILSVANTKISGLIQAAQIGSANASVINAGTLAGARLPANSVLQVVSVNHSAADTTTSTSFTDTGLEASITPSATSSKILIITTVHIGSDGGDGEHSLLQLVANGSGLSVFYGVRDMPSWATASQTNFSYLHSPSSTSLQTYKIRHRTTNAASESRYNYYSASYGITSNIILMEIAG
jgi:hypothetical protein